MQIVHDNLWLCDCCLFAAVNGDQSACQFYCGEEHCDAVDAGFERLGAHVTPDFDSETGEGCNEFSWRSCDCCNSKLGGSRHRFVILG